MDYLEVMGFVFCQIFAIYLPFILPNVCNLCWYSFVLKEVFVNCRLDIVNNSLSLSRASEHTTF